MAEDGKEVEAQERIREMQVAERRRAVGEDMASLLGVMSEVSETVICETVLSLEQFLNFFLC